ncbi:hypothetical protein GIB67_012404 [Kingdonia uniflora]|uniref:Uncharacterized protein n=1 Tax=Kingdonia uniflora TaxID=39325 RepID=A0A7J7LLR0_9MAGN|nr:hypothetical protein GIB67_012404 [Kingdonia uniflora]
MAFRAMMKHLGGTRMIATSTTPKMKPFAATADAHVQPRIVKAEFAPVYVGLGMVLLALSFAGHTAKQQLQYSPGVQVSKNRRETLPEVEDPDHVINDANNFINKNFFRKMARIQDFNRGHDPSRGDVFSSPRKVETLMSVGVDPSRS